MGLEPAVTVTVMAWPSTRPTVEEAVTFTGTDAVSAPAGLRVTIENR
jgi:hypothetical protein